MDGNPAPTILPKTEEKKWGVRSISSNVVGEVSGCSRAMSGWRMERERESDVRSPLRRIILPPGMRYEQWKES